MKTVEVKVYKYAELSEKAKEKAREWFIEGDYQDFSDERASLNAFEKIFPVRIGRWEFGGCRPYINFSFLLDDDHEELSGQRLATYLWNNYKDDIYQGKYYSKSKMVDGKYAYISRRSNIILESCCPLTGYGTDEDLLDPIRNFLKKPRDINFSELMEECLDAWIHACDKEWDYQQSEEYAAEGIEANDYEFTEDGRHWR